MTAMNGDGARGRRALRRLAAVSSLWLLCAGVWGATPEGTAESGTAAAVAAPAAGAETPTASSPPAARQPGVQYDSPGGRFRARAWLRGQLRYSNPFDSPPQRASRFDDAEGMHLDMRRARFKGEAQYLNQEFGSYVSLYYEHELTKARPMLDLRMDVALRDDLRLRIGQYKVIYNRERVDSSGKQQFAERSIATSPFTIDRQRGVTVTGQFARDSRANSSIVLGAFEGAGRSPGPRGDDPMLVGRWQWNFLGRTLGFAQSDTDMRERPAASLAFAGAHVRGPYTRFSSGGGGQLDGFSSGGSERYTLQQWMQEFAWQYAGMSVQQEFHVKEIEDHEGGRNSRLTGGYVQAGKIWRLPAAGRAPLVELAVRAARVDWEDTPRDRTQRELTLAGNLFLSGHDNKLTADLSWIDVDERAGPQGDDIRFRVQWDLSF
ncbi:MAG TPA: porin [Pseudomonadales bacterium]|nr:porin [Pseudomonadales bacterium]